MVVAGPSTEQVAGRAGGSRRPDDLRELAQHPSPRIRRIVASNPATPVDVLDGLAADRSESVRRCVAANPATPISCVVGHRLLLDRPHLLERALARRALTGDDLHLLARAIPNPYRVIAARSPALAPADVRHLSTIDDLVGVLAAAHRLPLRAFVRATRRGNMELIEAVARSPWNGAARRWWLTDGIIGERKHVARRIIAEHERASRLHLHRLRWWTTWQVKAALVRRDAVSTTTLRWWARHGPDGVREPVAEHPRTPPSVLKALANMSSVCRIAVARNPSLPPQLARQLAASREPWIAGTALANPSLPVEDIERLAQDTSLRPWQLRQLALNPSCPPGTREQILTWLALGGAGSGDPLFSPEDGAGRMPFGTWEELAPHLHRLSPVAHFRARAITGAQQLGRSELRSLATDPSPAVRYAAAGYMDGPTLSILARDEDPRVRQRVATTYQDAHRRRVNLVSPGTEPQAVRRRRQASLIGFGALLLVGALGSLLDGLDGRDERPVPPPSVRLVPTEAELDGVLDPSTASIVADPSRPNGAVVDVTIRNGATIVIVTGASLCEELGGPALGDRARLEIEYCGPPGPISIEARGSFTRDIIELDPPVGLLP